ncbi:unnamed protein product [Polarella glacialis]|uniref:Phosphoglycerate mutase n=1 Tax=Polarella glacialis TaxID=89957 RepID=A0A813DRQ6_POLGL|nr:unnamed protein product [Polarella glacialis]CAE8635240.1 unnamed protein product [Polarella glacialis]
MFAEAAKSVAESKTAVLARLWVVRHGERVDETPEGKQWSFDFPDQWHDPPLTAMGHQQALRAAEELAQELRSGSLKLEAVHCSPLRRAMQTAEPLSNLLGLPLQVVASAGGCTAALQKYGLAELRCEGQPSQNNSNNNKLLFNPSTVTRSRAIAGRAQLHELAGPAGSLLPGRAWPPPGPDGLWASASATTTSASSSKVGTKSGFQDLPLLNQEQRQELCPNATWLEDFDSPLEPAVEACMRLCQATMNKHELRVPAESLGTEAPIVLVVAHRELMWDLYEGIHPKGRMSTPGYASVLKLRLESSPEGGPRWLVDALPKTKT